MANLAYLLGAVILSGVGIAVIMLRGHKPTNTQSSIEAFQREMKALSPDGRRPDRRGGRPG